MSSGVPAHSVKRRRRVIRGWILVVIIGLLVAAGVRAFVFESFFVPSGSMLPTIQVGDHMIVDKLSYDLHRIGFGDIVVFRKPANDPAGPNVRYLVKRVIGLPGQVIASHGGKVYINGAPIAEPFLAKGVSTYGIPRQRIPRGEYYVLGDNRGNSADSRVFGPIRQSLIVGRVVLVYWPLGQWHYF